LYKQKIIGNPVTMERTNNQESWEMWLALGTCEEVMNMCYIQIFTKKKDALKKETPSTVAIY